MVAKNNIVLIGVPGSGKSQLLNKILGKPFQNEYILSTMPFEYNVIKTGSPETNNAVHHDTYDINGQERFEKSVPLACKNANHALICIDLTRTKDEDYIKETQRIVANCRRYLPESTQLIIVGTKSDLMTGNHQQIQHNFQIEMEKLMSFSQAKYIATSAKSGMGLPEVLDYIHHSIPGKEIIPSNFEIAQAELLASLGKLSKQKQQALTNELSTLQTSLLSNKSADEKHNAIFVFRVGSYLILGHKHPHTMQAVLTLAAVATVTLVAAVIGFGIGLIAGAWLGPASFLTALATGSAAAVAVVSVSASLGLIGGGITFFKTNPSKTNNHRFDSLDKFSNKITPEPNPTPQNQ